MSAFWKSKISRVLGAMASLCFIGSEAVQAGDIGTDLKDFWERSGGGVNYSRPTAYQGQLGGYVTLGSLYVRTRPRSSGLLNIQLPSIRAGCGGIDIFGGAFSFISKEELIQLGKAIMQNASSYANWRSKVCHRLCMSKWLSCAIWCRRPMP
jgi:conjugative transfer pilus assembly protein TraH